MLEAMLRRALLLLVPLLIAAAPAPIALRPAPGTTLDQYARKLSAAELRGAARVGDRPLVLVGSARLGPASEGPILFVQLQSARECGSAGCSTTAYRAVNGAWRRVLDSVSGPITVLPTRHDGFADLKVGDDRYAWNGNGYASLNPAPALDLRQQILRHQAATRAAKAAPRRVRRVPHPTSSPERRAPAPPA
jgi:hypothetical protein